MRVIQLSHMEPSTFLGFLVALALGGLVGIERELPW